MRTFLAVVATAALGYCLYVLLNVPVTTGTTMSTIIAAVKSQDRTVVAHVAGGAVAALVLFFLAIRKTRIVMEERKFDQVRDFIEQTKPWLEGREKRRAVASTLLVELETLEMRLNSERGMHGGLGATIAKLLETARSVTERVNELSASHDEDSDIPSDVASAKEMVETAGARFQALETALGQLPGLQTAAEDITRRVAALDVNRESLIGDLGTLMDRLDELLKDDGTIVTLESGHPDRDDDLQKQVKGLQDDVESALERLTAVEKTSALLPGLSTGVDDVEGRVKAFTDEDTGLVAQLVKINERLQLLLNEDDGILTVLEKGDPNSPDGYDNLADQITQIRENTDSVIERMKAISSQHGELDKVMRDLAKFTGTAVGPMVVGGAHEPAPQRSAS